jgi:hypothetical protein
MKYKVQAALRGDLHEGCVWGPDLGLEQRPIVMITYKCNNKNKSVYCEYLKIEPNYIREYNRHEGVIKIKNGSKVITMSEWYRIKLGISKTREVYDLEIQATNTWYGKIKASLQHPQAIVRIAIRLAIISLILGFIGLLPYLGKLLGLFHDIWQQSCICSNFFIICCP